MLNGPPARLLLAGVCACLLAAPACPAAVVSGAATHAAAVGASYADFATLLHSAVNGAGHVNYALLHRDHRLLDRVLAEFARVSPEKTPALFPGRNDRLAYWINAYNVFVLAGASRAWPVQSVRADGHDEFFRTQHYTAGGKSYTLNQIESDIIRKGFGEPRIHFTINCGATSCPVLKPLPFTGADLDRRLNDAARLFVNDPRNVTLDAAHDTLRVSEIFHWYADDFLTWLRVQRGVKDPSIPLFLALYRDPPDRDLLTSRAWTIAYIPYDWTLNADVLPVR